jgi:outer membrane protein TolC
MKPALLPARRLAAAAAGISAVASLVCGCAVGPDFKTPAAPPTQRYTRGEPPATTVAADGSAGAAQAFVAAEHAPQRWWTQFRSEPLNRLVDEALQHSPTLD